LLKKYLVTPLLPENRLVAIFDSCRSATLLDLPHHRCNRVYALTSRWRRTVRRVLEAFLDLSVEDFLTPRPFHASAATLHQARPPSSPRKICDGYCPRSKAFGNVLCISACKDSQRVYESANGISRSVTSYIISLLEEQPNPSLKRLMRVISSKFQASTRQMAEESGQNLGPIADPQLSSLRPQNMNMPFKL